MALVCRLHTQEDEPALIRFWSDHSGWDRVDAETWAHRLLRPPMGRAAIVVATEPDTGEVRGQFAFIPSLVSVGDREVTALRPFAPIVHKEQRGSFLSLAMNPLQHPVVAMYRHGVEALRARGDGLVYMMPDPNWARLFRLFPAMRCGSFPLWSRPLPLPAPLPLGFGYEAGPIVPRGDRVDRLWQAARRSHGCSVVRDSRSLPWKIGSGDYEILGVERNGELVGLVASRQKGERQWLICDLIAADTAASLRAVLVAACNLGHERSLAAEPANPITKVAVLVTPVLEPAVRELGFKRDAYDFHLVVQPLDPSLSKDEIMPARWYLSPND
jgi:hypothetical protein